jgi:transcriptional regulator with XRE-family HTH domain
MDDMRVGAAFRAVRLRRHWRKSDVAARAGVSRGFVSLVERGHLDKVSLATLRRLGKVLDMGLGQMQVRVARVLLVMGQSGASISRPASP